jgi:hypothetical protein
VFFQHGTMDDQELVSVTVDAPVHTPFQQGESLLAGQGLEGLDAVEVENRLRPHQAAQPRGNADPHMKVGKAVRVGEREGVVQQMEVFGDLGQGRADAEHERPGLQPQAVSAQAARELLVGQVAK